MLRTRERIVIELRYGLFDGVERTVQQVSERLRLGERHIEMIEESALKKLRQEQGSVNRLIEIL